MELMRRLPYFLLLALLLPAHAADERARIAQERRQAEAEYTARERACQSDFAVTACVDEAKAKRRKVLEELAQQEAVLDDAQRRQRAAQRMEQIHQNTARSEARPPETAASVQVKTPRPAAQAASSASAAAPHAGVSTGAAQSISAAERARNRAEFEQRQNDAEQHRDEVERRVLDRASRQDKPPTSLPARPEIPPASAP
jgi:hypothetical protein